ncbi:WD40 repeat-like protein [Tilletiaria anomala UBC 951]|uniref:WD40 repeat-like protein n=1 Tax=Tilletiaria anomala (strain ATCC 24038 / CBS 436.72 / UBC 951) TaxID=1037660 RepID=A0A066WEV0_TILAU|nr:WD40 repeat-like protein [Tilletiaria anomala UBC 951]KDN52472.1 WD40 repeat-like protein [Tilletiaria anomala UBC 951]
MPVRPEFEVTPPPSDPVSALAFHPGPSTSDKVQQLLIASWDKTVRLVDLSEKALQGSQVTPTLQTFYHDAAVLDVCWLSDTLAASGGLDRRVRLLNLETGQVNIIGKHNAPVCRLRFSPRTGLLISGSWDKTIGIWDPLAEHPTLLRKINVPDKVLALDVSPPWPNVSEVQMVDTTPRLIVAMAGRTLAVFNLDKLGEALRNAKAGGTDLGDDDVGIQPEYTRESSLKFMLRDVKCMPNGDGFACSSVEGRVAVEFFDNSDAGAARKYAFKCHRRAVDSIDTVYPVNCLTFHPIHGTFASLGGDAMCCIWDAVAKKRIIQYARLPSPLSTGACSADGQLLAIASGAENIEDARHPGPGAGEVGDIGPGGEGNVRIHIKSVFEDCRPKVKAS